MTPAFTSWGDFFAMGGYGFFVWLSVAVTLATLSVLIGHTLLQRRALLREIRQRQARERRIQAAKKQQNVAKQQENHSEYPS